MSSNFVRDNQCDYGYYAYTIGLAANIQEKDCNNPGTNFFQDLLFCDDHYPLVLNQEITTTNSLNINLIDKPINKISK